MAGAKLSRQELFENAGAPFQKGIEPGNQDFQDFGASFVHRDDVIPVLSVNETIIGSRIFNPNDGGLILLDIGNNSTLSVSADPLLFLSPAEVLIKNITSTTSELARLSLAFVVSNYFPGTSVPSAFYLYSHAVAVARNDAVNYPSWVRLLYDGVRWTELDRG